MKVAVCDDNREFCEKERTTIKDVFKQYFQGEDCQVDIYNDGQTIINNYPGNAYDMVFLDLELGDENGFDIAEQIVLMNNDAIIIFVTSHENLVYEAFRFRPLGYIVKDRFDREFTRMMVKIVDKLIKMRQVIELGGEKFYVDRVVSIATQKRKICVKSLKGEILLADSYSKHVAELEKYGFVQSSKGVLINMKYIKNSNEQLSNVGIHELSTSDVYSLRVATQLVGSYSTFSPLPLKNKWRLFSSTLIHPCERLPVKKQNALCCPDFPPVPQW